MYCNKCGAKLDDDSKFCSICGNAVYGNVQNQHGINIENRVKKSSASIKSKERRTFLSAPKLLGIVLLIGIIVFLSVSTIKNFVIRGNPVNRTLYGFNKLLKANSIDSTTDFKVKLTDSKNMDKKQKDIYENFTIRINAKSNKKTKEVAMDAAFIYKDQSILSAKAYTDGKNVVLSMPDLYSKTIYFKIEDINKVINESNKSGSIKIETYKDVYDLKKSKYGKAVMSDYYNFLKDNLKEYYEKGSKTTVKLKNGQKTYPASCDQLIFNIDSSELTAVMEKLIDKVTSDKKLKELVREKATKFLEIAEKNNDLEKFNISKESVKDFKSSFDKDWDKAMKETKEDKSYKEELKSSGFELKSSFKFDSKNNLRQMTYEIGSSSQADPLDLGIRAKYNIIAETTFNAINESVKIDKLKTSNGIDFAGISDSQKNQITLEMESKLETIMLKNLGL